MSDLNTPATKADLQQIQAEAKADLQQLGEQLRAATKADLLEMTQQLRDEFKEAIHDAQTELLRAFYTFAKSIEANITDLEKSDSGIRQRLAVAESRITELERRLNMPPAA